jgi:hypothetical protein
LPFVREATAELKLMAEAESPIISQYYLPCVQYLLQRGILIVTVSSYFDRVVNLCSSLLDGFDHPNIIRALYVHRYYLQQAQELEPADSIKTGNAGHHSYSAPQVLSAPSSSSSSSQHSQRIAPQAQPHPHHLHLFGRDVLLGLSLLVLLLRNGGHFVDLARFVTVRHLTGKVLDALGELGSLSRTALQESLARPAIPTSASSASSVGGAVVGGALSASTPSSGWGWAAKAGVYALNFLVAAGSKVVYVFFCW